MSPVSRGFRGLRLAPAGREGRVSGWSCLTGRPPRRPAPGKRSHGVRRSRRRDLRRPDRAGQPEPNEAGLIERDAWSQRAVRSLSDLLRLVGQNNVPPSSTNPTQPGAGGTERERFPTEIWS
jgi:hypothetical protein